LLRQVLFQKVKGLNMKAIRVHQQGGPEALTYEDVPMPEPGEGQARIKIEAIGVNFVDIYHRKGMYPLPTPFTPGSEAAGIVDVVGSGVHEVKVGDRVAQAMERGSYAEYAVLPAWKLVKIPDSVSGQTAAAVMLQGLTAHFLSHSTYRLQAGEWALVHAAAGGVGLLLTQLAKRRGARVIGTVSTEEKAEFARQAGADEVILYTQVDFEAETKRITNGKGVDVVYDSVGKDTFDKSLKCLRPRGYMVLYGAASGAVPPFDLQRLNSGGSLFVTRPSLGHYIQDRAELLQRTDDLFKLMASGELEVRIDKTFALADAPEAHRYMEARQSKGKVLLIP
jgi:NADPH:quinone reductase